MMRQPLALQFVEIAFIFNALYSGPNIKWRTVEQLNVLFAAIKNLQKSCVKLDKNSMNIKNRWSIKKWEKSSTTIVMDVNLSRLKLAKQCINACIAKMLLCVRPALKQVGTWGILLSANMASRRNGVNVKIEN
jgi:hypothetical protein